MIKIENSADSIFELSSAENSSDQSASLYRKVVLSSHGAFEDRPATLFPLIESAILKMASLHPEDNNYLLQETANAALVVLAILRHAKVSAPRVMPEDEETLSFTWDDGIVKRFLTVATDEMDITHFHRPSKQRAMKTIVDGGAITPSKVYAALGAQVSNSSVGAGD